MLSLRFPSLFALFLALIALPFTGCDSNDDDEGGDPQDACTASGSFTAQVNGSSFSAVCIVADFDSGAFFITGIENIGQTGTSDQRQINITYQGASVGQVAISPLSGVIVSYAEGSDPADIGAFVALSGSLNLTELSDSGAAGTFSFEASDTLNGGTASVTNGTFDVTF